MLAHGGSVYWNAYRGRWVMIAVESFGSTSFLGEVWYAEADTPLGPWVYARKVVTHDKYSFYNPKQHPMFDQEGGRIIFFEGTYTTTFSGNTDPTPRYDYNQVMYRLDLSDRRLALPVAVYEVPAGRGLDAADAPAAGRTEARESRPAAWLSSPPIARASRACRSMRSPTRAAGASCASGPRRIGRRDRGRHPCSSCCPTTAMPRTRTRSGSARHQDGTGGRRSYSVESPGTRTSGGPRSRVLGRVWPNPATSLRW